MKRFHNLFLITILIIGGAAVFLLAGFSQGYNTGWTHPTLAEKSARLFNQYDGSSLSEADIQQIVQGVINEDTPPRYINHFYDPTTGQGWTGEKMGIVPASVVRQISLIGLSQSDAVSASNWAQNQALQSRYSAYEGNRTFQKAVYDYVNGDKASAYRSLGHVLHLIEDMTVPAHTRQDTHFDAAGDPGEPLEKWVEQTKDLSSLSDLNPTQENFHCQNLNDCFNQIARYSNENFFSEDTIFDKDYNFINYSLKQEGTRWYGISNGIYLFTADKDVSGNLINFTLQDPKIQSAYWQRLSKKAVFGGAEVIRIFQEEVAKAEKDKSLLEKPPSAAMPIFSLFGTGVQISSWARGLWNNAVSKINSLSTFMSSLVGGNADVAQTLIDLPNGLTVNQTAIDQLSGANHGDNNESNSPQPSLALRGGENEDGASIVNIIPQNFPSTSSRDTLQPINIVPEMPMVLGETADIGDDGAENVDADAETQSPVVSNLTVPLGAGAGSSGQPPAEEAVQQEQETELPTASSTPEDEIAPPQDEQSEETASTTGEDLIPPETYATSAPVLSGQPIATNTIVFEFSSSEATSTFECRLDNASSTVCVSPMEYQNLADGEHEFEVEAIDAAGNIDPTPVIFDWTVDATAPEISLSLVDYQLTSINFAVAWNSSSSDVASYEIQNKVGEDGVWQDWTTSATSNQKNFQANQDETTYYFRGRATDNLSNQSAWQEIAAGVNQYPVVINEIAWMGTTAAYSSDEWIELYNKTDQDIDLNGWTLRAVDNTPNIILATTVPAHGFYLLEKQDDDTISSIEADQVYTSVLMSNAGETLELSNEHNRLIDSTPIGGGWAAGDNHLGYPTMERVNPDRDGTNVQNWATNDGATINGLAANGTTPVHGTPKAQNSRYDPSLAISTIIFDNTIISSDTIWPLSRSPYILESNVGAYPTVAVGATLIIEPGVTVKPSSTVAFSLIVKGTLLAQGTSEKPIIFTSNQATPQSGDWTSIIFKPESTGSVLENVIFEYGGREFIGYSYVDYSMVSVDQSSVTIKDCQFQKAGWIALKLSNSSALVQDSIFTENVKGVVIDGMASHPTIRDSEFQNTNHQGTGIEISNGATPSISSNDFSNFNYPIVLKSAYPVFSDNLVSNNRYNGVYIDCKSRFIQDTNWQNNLTYILESNSGEYPTIASGTVLTIEQGTVIKPTNKYYTALVIEGRLVAEGTGDEPIIFTSFKDDSFGGDSNNDGNATAPGDSGDWKDIVFSAGSSGSLDNIHFKYGGYGSGLVLNIDPAAEVILGDGVLIN